VGVYIEPARSYRGQDRRNRLSYSMGFKRGTGRTDRSNSKWWWRYDGPVITLSQSEECQVITWATRLRDLATGRNVDWSATWTEEDLADARRSSLSRFDERERE
jgi:hypothetical protein